MKNYLFILSFLLVITSCEFKKIDDESGLNLKQNDINTFSNFEKGEYYYKKIDYPTALSWYKQVLPNDPNYQLALEQIGRCESYIRRSTQSQLNDSTPKDFLLISASDSSGVIRMDIAVKGEDNKIVAVVDSLVNSNKSAAEIFINVFDSHEVGYGYMRKISDDSGMISQSVKDSLQRHYTHFLTVSPDGNRVLLKNSGGTWTELKKY
ncbi:MAG TPA: hypothetical protein PLG90_00130 [Ignavibacteria bacterium]|nr:hypothetical protein [Ignavibacteria bacterium]